MKKLLSLASLVLAIIGYSQDKTNTEIKDSRDKSLLIKTDHSELQAKKSAAEEKTKLPKPYNPKADAQSDINTLIAKAKVENKNIMIQAGGNWCIWCLRFNDFVQKTPELKNMVDTNYLYYHLNFSPDNKNEKIFAEYGNPGDKFGYPVFIILDNNGKLIHIQQSDVLEEGNGYSLEKVKDFFKSWTPKS
ncbi:thioredoxin family protein [Chryseobacterium fistulae]|uniref:Thioredoxin family protein n=1 Tax=Chryseobacterium fistulae TaxID=2675058 RepID=A0A6N4XTF4_9FLAO|nr:thioredoxin family protein [Chryseobacterium fistulae]CAA7387052.1 hypothetical protein CHRY9393_01354 [Chryseobacterium fistulae]